MIKVTLSNEILKYITDIEKNRYIVSERRRWLISYVKTLKKRVLMHLTG